VIEAVGISDDTIEQISRREREEIERREHLYRGDLPPLDPTGRTAVLVDDGLATGATMRAAVAALRERAAGRVVVAVPVSSPDTCAEFEPHVDAIVCAATPEPFLAVGVWYDDFRQVTDAEVTEVLDRAAQRRATSVRANHR
jgi:putative phosphoribosyl transferase